MPHAGRSRGSRRQGGQLAFWLAVILALSSFVDRGAAWRWADHTGRGLPLVAAGQSTDQLQPLDGSRPGQFPLQGLLIAPFEEDLAPGLPPSDPPAARRRVACPHPITCDAGSARYDLPVQAFHQSAVGTARVSTGPPV